ncbi:MAG: hypothetical protein MPK62_01575 [Alphaproteobacteria bacterium]|nr:hypothetical protein [Alphaproteobacteria bacterium]MDA8029824.1 hypothetical protein [Alphaproteobacteria bacterium]
MTDCKGICQKMQGITNNGNNLYKNGIVYCRHCRIGFKCRDEYCPCCRLRLRRKPRERKRRNGR